MDQQYYGGDRQGEAYQGNDVPADDRGYRYEGTYDPTRRDEPQPADESYYSNERRTARYDNGSDPVDAYAPTARYAATDPYAQQDPYAPQDSYMQPDAYTARAKNGVEDLFDNEEKPVAPRRKKKKKKLTFKRVMRGVAAWLAEMPTKTLLLFGGSFALVLLAIILLIVLLPKKAAEDTGLSIIDAVTPSPTLGITPTPEITPEPEITPDPDPLGGVNISLNMFHAEVENIQNRLIELGYMLDAGEYATNEAGYRKYGPSTKNAVRRFQLRNQAKLVALGSLSTYPDGVVGAVTYNLLMSEDATSFYMRPGDEDNGTNGLWSETTNPLVTNLQKKLVELGYLTSGQVTGKYGDTTYKAVELFQLYNSLSSHDGYAGQETLNLLESGTALNAADGKVAYDAAKAAGVATTSPDPSATTVPDDAASTGATGGTAAP